MYPAGAIGAILKFFKRKTTLVLDSVEPHAESMVECKIWKPSGLKFKLLFFMEKFQIKKANSIIMATEGMVKYIKEKWVQNKYTYESRYGTEH